MSKRQPPRPHGGSTGRLQQLPSGSSTLALAQAMQQAGVAYNGRDWARAEQICRSVLGTRADHFGALNLLGIIAAQTRRVAEAADLLGRAVAANPGDADAHNNLGNVLKGLGRLEPALASYEQALAIKPGHAEAWNNRGVLLHELGRLEPALASYEQALKVRPRYAEACSNRGHTLQALGRHEEALKSYERSLQVNPDNAAAENNRGLALRNLGRREEALACLDKALAIRSDYPEACNNRGVTLQDLGQLPEACASFERALAIAPRYAEACNNLGNCLRQLRRADEALALYARAMALKPDYAEAAVSQGNLLHELGRPEEALASFDRAIAIRPDYAEACNNRGVTLQQLQRFEAALASFDLALGANPDYADAWNNRGVTLHELERHDEALASLDRALLLRPEDAEAHSNRGNALNMLNRLDDALASYARALQIRPDYAEAWNNRGITLCSRGRPAEALESYERALQIRPGYAEVYHNRGVALQDLKRVDEVLSSYTQALSLDPALDWVPGLLLSARMQVCEWSGLDGRLEELLAGIAQGRKATPPFAVIGLCDSPAVQRQVAATWVAAKYPDRKQLPAIAQQPRRDRIRLGYYSADFHEHATAYLIAELLELHDRRRFEVVAISFGPDSQHPMRRRLVAAADEFVDVRANSAREVAALSRSMAIDIAVDLKGYTQDSRTGIFAHRAAPIQVSYLGYPGTLGAPYMDYLIADHALVPEASRGWYSEKIAYLPGSYQVNDRQRPISGRAFTREQLGLPPAGFVWCCFNNNYKITPRTFDGWMRLLGQVPGSVLWLLKDNDTAAANLRREAERRGVAAERLVFAPRMPLAEHLARHRHADLFLDTLPCNAHTTASDALWAGLPVLTLAGESFAGRVAASLLEAVGLPELVAATQARYEELALALATEPGRLAGLRARLQENRSGAPLFDTDRFARHIEDAYLQMHERYHAGHGPGHLFVAAS